MKFYIRYTNKYSVERETMEYHLKTKPIKLSDGEYYYPSKPTGMGICLDEPIPPVRFEEVPLWLRAFHHIFEIILKYTPTKIWEYIAGIR